MTNKGFGTKPEIPSHYKTVEEVINQYCPDVWDMIKKKNGIKRTGSLDEIPMKKRKEIKKVLKIYINIKAQRVDAIEISKLFENLEREGGFKHESAGTLDLFRNNKYQIDVCPDGMHRLIKALLCGVDELACVYQNQTPIDMSDEDATKKEFNYFQDKNEHNSPASTSTRNRVAKESNEMNQKQQSMDDIFSDRRVKIHVNAYGTPTSATSLHYWEGHEVWYQALAQDKNNTYIGPDVFDEIRDYIVKHTTGKSSMDISFSYWFGHLPHDMRSYFSLFLDSNEFKNRDAGFWTAGGQHNYGEETTIIRIGCCFNEFLRKMTSDNKVTPDMIKFLRKMNVETQHFVENCLVRNLSVDAAILNQIFDKEDEDQTAEELNQTFHTV